MSAIVRVKNAKGRFIRARALLDTCATAHFVTEDFANSLGFPMKSYPIPISAINGTKTASKHILEFSINSIHNEYKKSLSFLTIPKIADSVPDELFPRESIIIPANLKLADPHFHVPRPVDMLLGSGATLSLLSIGQINLSRDKNDLVLQKTQLGWVIAGGITDSIEKRNATCNLTELEQEISKFWHVEDLDVENSRSGEEKLCEDHYSTNTTRDHSGRYIVRLPFRPHTNILGESRKTALRRFYLFQKKLDSNPEMKVEYNRVMQEYVDLGHMSLIKDESLSGYYLPQLAVVKTSSSTTKFRVVFDASAKTDNGISLNDNLMIGPTIQDPLFRHLLRFRSYSFVLIADIEKMYRQIIMNPSDRRFQRVFWNKNGKIETYELNTVTFGMSSSSFLSIRTIHQLVDDEGAKFPLASAILKRDLYVDDLLTGANSLKEIRQIRSEIVDLLKRGGFNIRQWVSNHKHALDNAKEKALDDDGGRGQSGNNKTLGVLWNSQLDQLSYTVKNADLKKKITKRNILSEIAKIFDPLGLLGPVILFAKSIMQKCWQTKVNWDESVPISLNQTWKSFIEQLPLIKQIKISRKITVGNPIYLEIHGFCDASKVGYGACLYARSCGENGEILTRLICAKSRVAPLKQITIPQLELCGALTLSRLYNEMRGTLNVSAKRIIFWCDSTIVLHWLKKSPQILRTFEANRVREIQTNSEGVEWRYVRTRDNPADALSRGQLPSEFLRNKIWFSGPSWLKSDDEDWPPRIDIPIDNLPGLKKQVCFLANAVSCEIFSRFSSITKLTHVIAYILRFRHKRYFYKGALNLEEKLAAERKIVFMIQRDNFFKEISQIQSSNDLKQCRLKSLDPFIDEYGIMRVGGRLVNADVSSSRRHPMLLPSRNFVTDPIIRETHERAYHAGTQSTLYALRQRFWLLDGKNQVRKVIKNCTRCLRYRPTILHSKMADLPEARVNRAEIFSHVGVDFFGPLFIKEKKFRNRNRIKVYGCIFVCISIKAVHLEIVTDLTTVGFLGALRRFIARRGIPTDIYSDNGTNFVGANSQLKEIFALAQSEKFKEHVNQFALHKNIKWHFNPPLSPHFGGIWEAAVKSFKHHFKRVIGESIFTYEELYTFAVEIEAILNSRPLCPMSPDPNDPQALTPADFLIGRPMNLLPESVFDLIPDNRLSSWKRISKARQHFWRRWQIEYLSELQKRQKWFDSNSRIKVDSIVILIDKNRSCAQWQLGRIIATHPGGDGETRVVTVRTANGILKRNITTLCLLPTETKNLEETTSNCSFTSQRGE